MGKIAFLFSGQGAQRIGMGKEIYDAFSSVRALFDSAEKTSPGILSGMFGYDGAGADFLKTTANVQPALYLADLGGAIALEEKGIKPDFLAGFSLGEIPALAFGGAFSHEDGFKIAEERGRLMSIDAKANPAGMAAVLKVDNSTVESVCKKYKNIYPVNYNCPGQLVVSGTKDELPKFIDEIKSLGGRAVVLGVEGGFHSVFMSGAAKAFRLFLDGKAVSKPKILVYSNYSGKPYGSEDDVDMDIRDLMGLQIDHPIYWEKIIRKLADLGTDIFIETGVGNVLTKLVEKTLPGAAAFAVENPEDISRVCREAALC